MQKVSLSRSIQNFTSKLYIWFYDDRQKTRNTVRHWHLCRKILKNIAGDCKYVLKIKKYCWKYAKQFSIMQLHLDGWRNYQYLVKKYSYLSIDCPPWTEDNPLEQFILSLSLDPSEEKASCQFEYSTVLIALVVRSSALHYYYSSLLCTYRTYIKNSSEAVSMYVHIYV